MLSFIHSPIPLASLHTRSRCDGAPAFDKVPIRIEEFDGGNTAEGIGAAIHLNCLCDHLGCLQSAVQSDECTGNGTVPVVFRTPCSVARTALGGVEIGIGGGFRQGPPEGEA